MEFVILGPADNARSKKELATKAKSHAARISSFRKTQEAAELGIIINKPVARSSAKTGLKWRPYLGPNSREIINCTARNDADENQPKNPDQEPLAKNFILPPPGTFPLKFPNHLRPTVQFLLKAFSPALYGSRYLSRNSEQGTKHLSPMPLVLHVDIIFFGTLSVASTVRDTIKYGSCRTTREALTIDRIIVNLLRQAVQQRNVSRDLLIWAIHTQCVVHWLRQENEQAEIHAKAIRALAETECQQDKTSATDSWTQSVIVSYQKFDRDLQTIREMEGSISSFWGPLQYPVNATPAEIHARFDLSKTPLGVVSLCLSGKLSYPVIKAVSIVSLSLDQHHIFAPTRDDNDNDNDNATAAFDEAENRINGALCIRLFMIFPLLPILEKTLLMAIFSYCYFHGHDPGTWHTADSAVQVFCLRVLEKPLPTEEENLQPMLWEAMMLRAVYGDQTPAREYADHMMRYVEKADPSLVASRYEVARRFFWDERLEVYLKRFRFSPIPPN